MGKTAYWAEDRRQIKTHRRCPHEHTNTHSPVKFLLMLWQQRLIPFALQSRFSFNCQTTFPLMGVYLSLSHAPSVLLFYSFTSRVRVWGGPCFPLFIDKQKAATIDLHTHGATGGIYWDYLGTWMCVWYVKGLTWMHAEETQNKLSCAVKTKNWSLFVYLGWNHQSMWNQAETDDQSEVVFRPVN